MKRITKLSLPTSSLGIVHVIFLADLLLMVPMVNAADTQGGDPISSSSSSQINRGKKEDRMNTANDSLKTLTTLSQNKIDEAFLLDQAINDIARDDVKKQLTSYKEKLYPQVQELANLIRELKGEPPKYSRDLKTLFNQGWEKLRGLASEEGELTALYNNITKILEAEEQALRAKWPQESERTLRNLADSTKQLKDYLENQAIPQSRVAASAAIK